MVQNSGGFQYTNEKMVINGMRFFDIYPLFGKFMHLASLFECFCHVYVISLKKQIMENLCFVGCATAK